MNTLAKKPKVLFACAENKKRSQMAEAIFNSKVEVAGLDAQAISGGTFPAGTVDPLTVKVLEEHGIKAAGIKPKELTDDMFRADIIISFGCLVPSMFPKDKFREWHIEDPQTKADFEAAYATIETRVNQLITELLS